jgi:hypothetical protein
MTHPSRKAGSSGYRFSPHWLRQPHLDTDRPHKDQVLPECRLCPGSKDSCVAPTADRQRCLVRRNALGSCAPTTPRSPSARPVCLRQPENPIGTRGVRTDGQSAGKLLESALLLEPWLRPVASNSAPPLLDGLPHTRKPHPHGRRQILFDPRVQAPERAVGADRPKGNSVPPLLDHMIWRGDRQHSALVPARQRPFGGLTYGLAISLGGFCVPGQRCDRRRLDREPTRAFRRSASRSIPVTRPPPRPALRQACQVIWRARGSRAIGCTSHGIQPITHQSGEEREPPESVLVRGGGGLLERSRLTTS